MLGFSACAQETKPALEAQGKGVQIYTCNAEKGWVFQAPEATLYIGSKTPAEIAISILAELTAVKNGVFLSDEVRVEKAKAKLQQDAAASTCGIG